MKTWRTGELHSISVLLAVWWIAYSCIVWKNCFLGSELLRMLCLRTQIPQKSTILHDVRGKLTKDSLSLAVFLGYFWWLSMWTEGTWCFICNDNGSFRRNTHGNHSSPNYHRLHGGETPNLSLLQLQSLSQSYPFISKDKYSHPNMDNIFDESRLSPSFLFPSNILFLHCALSLAHGIESVRDKAEGWVAFRKAILWEQDVTEAASPRRCPDWNLVKLTSLVQLDHKFPFKGWE